MLRQSLSQRMIQKLSPQQIQLMKLLQIPTATLDQRIKEELEINPALEEADEYGEVFDINEDEFSDDSDHKDDDESFELDDYINEYIDDDPSLYKMKAESYMDDEEKAVPMAVSTSFHEFLIEQLGMMDFINDIDRTIAEQIIGSMDEDGYLRRESEALVDDLLFTQNLEVEVSDIERVLVEIQKMEPVGIGARTLQESLIIQLESKFEKETVQEKIRIKNIAIRILTKYFDEFSKKHYSRLKRSLGLSDSELKDAIDEIIKLNPKPASTFTNGINSAKERVNQYIVPDFIISNRDNELELTLNNKNAPDLRISDQYVDILKGYKDGSKARQSTRQEKETVMFIKQKIDSAKWFIDAIKQRQETLHNTMYTIMQYQKDYFLTGDERRIKPMILKDIAEVTGLDISTVSRVANSKFVQTEFGTKRLKDFFSESIQTQDGEEVSTLEVKNILTELIQKENKKKTLSDEFLKEVLQKKGYNIARRTVAKYREQLNIPVARLRKEL
jgi:RNA polymerase sigma-54 factor